jgi:glycine/D-amino acid oxidase-like deaminating enzyme
MKILLIGQGISGTWLSYWLLKQGANVVVMDRADPNTSSRIASGVINPVTGRQVATTWMAETLLPFSESAYGEMGDSLKQRFIHNTGILAFPPSEQMVQGYEKKMACNPSYVQRVYDMDALSAFFHFSFGAVHINPVYCINLPALLPTWRAFLENSGRLRYEVFDPENLVMSDTGVRYQDEFFDVVVYCEGPAAFSGNIWQGLPYSFMKGEAVIAEIPGLPGGQIYKFGITTLVPWINGQWWLGSTYDNSFADALPTAAFRQRMEYFLQSTLKLPYTITGHLAAVRPASLDRRPFVGRHPNMPALAIFNGMGTKGVSLAPWFGKQLAEHLITGAPLDPMVDISRFKRAFE